MFDFSPYSAVFLDLDGTLYYEEHPLTGAEALVNRLQNEQRKFACLSNSTLSPLQVCQKLARMKMKVEPDQIYTAAAATADYVTQHFGNKKPRLFNLATEGIREMLQGRVTWVETGEERCDAVIVGSPVSVYATEERQRIALELLRNGAQLVGMCADRVYPSPRGIEFGSGALSAMLAYAANVQPIFCGKPEALFFHELCDRLTVKPQQCILIGDNLEADIAGAKAVGMATILTLTGVARRKDLANLPPQKSPEWVIEDLTEL